MKPDLCVWFNEMNKKDRKDVKLQANISSFSNVKQYHNKIQYNLGFLVCWPNKTRHDAPLRSGELWRIFFNIFYCQDKNINQENLGIFLVPNWREQKSCLTDAWARNKRQMIRADQRSGLHALFASIIQLSKQKKFNWQHDWRSEGKQRPKRSPFLGLPAKFWIFTTVRNVSRGSNEETNEGLAEVTAVRCFLHCINLWPMGEKLLSIQTQSHFTSHPHISE